MINEQTALTTTEQAGFLAPAVTVEKALAAYQAKKELIDGIMKQGVDFGVIPGSSKPTLLKAGAEKATSFFGLSPHFKDAGIVEDWTGKDHGGEPFFYYRRTCELWRGDNLVASVDGSCNSWEKKYRYRWVSEFEIPVGLDKTKLKTQGGKSSEFQFAIEKAETGGKYGKPPEYWKAWNDAIDSGKAIQITRKTSKGNELPAFEMDATVYAVPNSDPADQVNTILKMADKRALIAATLIATGLSEYFTQDIEDYVIGGDVIEGEIKPAHAQPENISQEDGKVTTPIELVSTMGDWAVGEAAKKWNCDKPQAAKELGNKKLGRMSKADFLAWLDDPK